MRTWYVPVAGVAVAALVLSGCGPVESTPLSIDGPNQVIYSVPGMT